MDWATALGIADTHTPQHVFAIRLFLAALFGGMIGFEREASTYGSAGLRTHILIATAAVACGKDIKHGLFAGPSWKGIAHCRVPARSAIGWWSKSIRRCPPRPTMTRATR